MHYPRALEAQKGPIIPSNTAHIIINENTSLLPITMQPASIESDLLFRPDVAAVVTNHMARRVVRRIPSLNLRIRNLPQLKSLSTPIQSHKLLPQRIVPPFRQEDSPEVVVDGAEEDAVNAG
jgi:hypothetical protein